ncbi:hypothetical protein B0H11DRAFT_1926520 [Mycena galericulata]|nr:hypothetical protein B0H11DRAFT_1926520 [Mycena galericulata]
MSDPPKKFVYSPTTGAIYWRDPTASFWKGPRHDRVFVPSMDFPEGVEPPPDNFANVPGAPASNSATGSAGSAATQGPANSSGLDGVTGTAPAPTIPNPAFGTLPPFNYTGATTTPNPIAAPVPPPAQPNRQPGATNTHPGGEWQTVQRRDPDPQLPPPPPYYNGYQGGVMETTLRYRELMRQRNAARQRGDDRGYSGGPSRHGPSHYRPSDSGSRYHPLAERESRSGQRSQSRGRYHPEPEQRPRHNESRPERQLGAARGFMGRAPPATQSRPSLAPSTLAPAPGFVPIPPPIVELAPRGPNGHPIFPETIQPDEDVSDYGNSEDDSEDENKTRKIRRDKERKQLTKALSKAGLPTASPAMPPHPNPSQIGPWAGHGIYTIAEARNLIKWVTSGCQRSRALYDYIMQYHHDVLTADRSDGVLHLVSAQNQTETAWLLRTTGDPTPRSRRDPNAPTLSRNARRRESKRKKARASGKATEVEIDEVDATVNQGVADIDLGDDEPTASEERMATFPSTLGSSRAAANYVADPSDNQSPATASGLEAMQVMQSLSPQLWEAGIRLENGQWPAENSPIGSTPWAADMLAARFLHFIAPEENTGLRAEFMELAITGLSLFGLYERMVQRGEWQYAERALEHFPFSGPLSHSMVLAWIHQHGIPTQGRALIALRAYAASWRNQRERNPSPTGNTFHGEPRDSHDVLSWPDRLITHWRQLVYHPVLPGVITEFPRHPCVAASTDTAPEDGEVLEPTDSEMAREPGEPAQDPIDSEMSPAPEDGANADMAYDMVDDMVDEDHIAPMVVVPDSSDDHALDYS